MPSLTLMTDRLQFELMPGGKDMSLFEKSEANNLRTAQPLAARMRPSTLEEFVGQQHFLGEGKLLRRLLRPIAWGP